MDELNCAARSENEHIRPALTLEAALRFSSYSWVSFPEMLLKQVVRSTLIQRAINTAVIT